MRTRGAIAIAFCALILAAPVGGAAAAEVTNSSEDLRTGWYPNESAISPESVSSGSFGQEWSASVAGQVYAQPLLAGGTLLVATEHNMVYGLDPATGAPKWSTPLGPSWNPAEIGCNDLTPEIGVTGTPVIDTSTNTAYMTHKTYKSGSEVAYYMDAIDMTTGKEKEGFPVPLEGSAQNASGKTFDARDQLQRPGLLLMEGVVYAAFGSDCDIPPYQGWVFGVGAVGSAKAHQVTARWTSETADNGSGIWQSGAGLTSDGAGTILLSTGNGSTPEPGTPGSKPPGTLGQSIVRLRVQGNGELTATDFFAPSDAAELASWDADFASGGVTGLPGGYFGTSSIPNLAVAVGKDGYVYLLNRDNLGGIAAEGEAEHVVQRLGPYGGVWSRPGVWPGEGGWVYIPTASDGETAGGSSGYLRVYKYGVSGEGKPTLSLDASSKEAFGFSSSAPVITSHGTVAGSALVWLVWAPNGSGEGAQLRAYDPLPVGGEPHLRWSAPVGRSAKFAIPGVGGGRIFVGTRDGHVLAFGSPVPPPLTGTATEFPPTIVGQSSEGKVTLTANEELEIVRLTTTSQFGVTSQTIPLNAGEKREVPVTFSPTTPGLHAGVLTAVIDTATSKEKEVQFSLSGAGEAAEAKLEVSPPVVSFGGTTVGGTAPSQPATLTNVGAGTLTIKSIELQPATSQFRAALPKGELQIPPHESREIPLEFAPTEVGSFGAELVIESTGGNARLKLTGSAATPGHLQISPATVEFAPVAVGGSEARTFVLSNTGGVPVHVYESRPPTGAFRATSELAEETAIAPGESIAETVAFAPTAPGPAAAPWVIAYNDTTGLREAEVTFTGEGVQGKGSSAPAPAPPELRVLPFKTSGPEATLASTSLTASQAGTLTLLVRCPAGETACVGTVSLRTLSAIRLRGFKHASILTVGSASFTVAAGHVTAVRLHLSRVARELLARHHQLRLRALVAAHDGAGLRHTETAIVTIRLAPHHGR